MHVLGIDVGGTKTVCLLANEDGRILGEGLGPGGTSVLYEVQPLIAGTYQFRCDTHPFMNGTFIVG